MKKKIDSLASSKTANLRFGMVLQKLWAVIALAAIIGLTACPTEGDSSSSFTAVASITGVPATGTVGSFSLSGIVSPTAATNKTIAWSVVSAGTTNATISGNTLTTTAAGTVTVRATIAKGKTKSTDYTQDFSIEISVPAPVNSFPGTWNGSWTSQGTTAPATLTITETGWTFSCPSLGYNESGTYTFQGDTMTLYQGASTVGAASLASNSLDANFTAGPFAGESGSFNKFIPVTSITGIPASYTLGNFALNGTVNPHDATNQTIAWSLVEAGTTGASLSGNSLTTITAGTVTVRATIANGKAEGTDYTQEFAIEIGDSSGGSFTAVTSITGIPASGTVGTLTLNGTVNPSGATHTSIGWSLVSAGTTGASLIGNTLTTTAAGTVTVRATITDGKAEGTDYTEEFSISISTGGGSPQTNPFVGFWDGSWTSGGATHNAVITISGSAWGIESSAHGLSETGTYAYTGNTITFLYYYETITLGSATVSGNTFSINFSSGPFMEGSGTFTRRSGYNGDLILPDGYAWSDGSAGIIFNKNYTYYGILPIGGSWRIDGIFVFDSGANWFSMCGDSPSGLGAFDQYTYNIVGDSLTVDFGYPVVLTKTYVGTLE